MNHQSQESPSIEELTEISKKINKAIKTLTYFGSFLLILSTCFLLNIFLQQKDGTMILFYFGNILTGFLMLISACFLSPIKLARVRRVAFFIAVILSMYIFTFFIPSMDIDIHELEPLKDVFSFLAANLLSLIILITLVYTYGLLSSNILSCSVKNYKKSYKNFLLYSPHRGFFVFVLLYAMWIVDFSVHDATVVAYARIVSPQS